MANERVDLRNGGQVAVLLGAGAIMPEEYRSHEAVIYLDTTAPFDRSRKLLPPDVRLVVLTEAIPQLPYQIANAEIRNRNLVYLVRKSERAIKATLDDLFAGPANGYAPITDIDGERPGPEPGHAGHGQISALAKELDTDQSKSAADVGRKVFETAKARGIKTTIGSTTQSVRAWRRKRGHGDRPVSADPQGGKLSVLVTLDEAIASLSGTLTQVIASLGTIRDYVEAVETENVTLRARVAAIEKALDR